MDLVPAVYVLGLAVATILLLAFEKTPVKLRGLLLKIGEPLEARFTRT